MPNKLESGLQITLPDTNYFIISNCTTWSKELGLFSLKEMDFGWWDRDKNKLYFLEVKDFTKLDHPKAKKPPDPMDFLNSFITKGTDMLILLAGIWLSSAKGQKITNDLLVTCPDFPRNFCKFQLFFVVKTSDPNAGIWLSAMKIVIQDKLKGRVMLFDLNPVDDVVLIAHQDAINLGLPIREATIATES